MVCFCSPVSMREAKRLKFNSTFEEILFTFCPPLPELLLVLKVSSEIRSMWELPESIVKQDIF